FPQVDAGDDLTDSLPTTQPHCQGCGRAEGHQDDSDNRVEQLGLDLQLTNSQRHSNDDQKPLYQAADATGVIGANTFHRALDHPSHQVGEQQTGQQDQRSAEHLGQIECEGVEGGRYSGQTQCLGGRHYKGQHDEPVYDLAHHRRDWRSNAYTAEHARDPCPTHKPVQTQLGQPLAEHRIDNTCHDKAQQNNDQGGDEIGNEGCNFG